MTGIILLAFILLFAYVAWKISFICTSKLPHIARIIISTIAIALATPLLVIDEIIASREFDNLCKTPPSIKDEISKKEVILVYGPHTKTKSLGIEIVSSKTEFLDQNTQESLGIYYSYKIYGGFFIKTLGISNSNSPLIIHPSYCSPGKSDNFAKKHNFTIVNSIRRENQK